MDKEQSATMVAMENALDGKNKDKMEMAMTIISETIPQKRQNLFLFLIQAMSSFSLMILMPK